MKVKMLVSRSGPGGTENSGDTIDVSEAEAGRMIAAGQAELARSAKPEKAVKRSKFEKAVK